MFNSATGGVKITYDKMEEKLVNAARKYVKNKKKEGIDILPDSYLSGSSYISSSVLVNEGYIDDLSSYAKDEIVEVNRSNFFLWSSSMEKPITIDKVGSQIDVLPTLLNLFGAEYDSRLIVGKDILSDYPGIAIFSNRSWVSDYGTYFSGGKFILKDGKNLDNQEEYIKEMNNRVANGFSISKMLMNSNYYDVITKE